MEKRNEKGVTAISTAAHKGNINIMNMLIEKGCDVNKANKLKQSLPPALAQENI